MTKDDDFTQFVHAYGAALRRNAYVVVQDWHMAEDLTQQALIKVYVNWSRSDTERRLAFARKILVRECLSALRRRRETPVVQVPERQEFDDESALSFLDCIASLPPKQRAIVALRIYEDMSVEHVAEILKVSEGTVKSQTSRALTKLRTASVKQQSKGHQ